MATKKSAKKTTPAVEAVAPAAKKTVKKAAKKAATKTAAKKVATKAAKKATTSPDEVARAAYMNYRRRVEQGLPGDSESDWLEAERFFDGT